MRRLGVGTSYLRIFVVSAVTGGLIVGCQEPDARLSGDGVDRERMYRVAQDVNATPSEVVEAGRAVDAARSGRYVLVAYTVHNDTDEGRSAAAWRLHDGDSGTVAEEYAGETDEGSAHPQVYSVPQGFLVSDQDGPWWHLGIDGIRTRVIRAGSPMVPQPADVPVTDGSPRLFRPATRTLFTAAPRPTRQWQGWAVADDGTLWMQGSGTVRNGPVPFFRSAAGRPWQPVSPYNPGKGRWVDGLGLASVGSRLVAPVLAETLPDRARLVALIVRPDAGPADQPWQVLRPSREAAAINWFDVRVSAADDTTALVASSNAKQYLVDLTDATWRSMPSPTDEDDWSYESESGRIYATHSKHADAWFTDNWGEGWERLPH